MRGFFMCIGTDTRGRGDDAEGRWIEIEPLRPYENPGHQDDKSGQGHQDDNGIDEKMKKMRQSIMGVVTR